MKTSEKTYSFTQEPVWEGKWYATREYKVLNCLGQTKTLRAEDGPIQSPFGIHNVSISAGHFSINHNTIVWNAPEKPKKANCGMENIVEGLGSLSITLNVKDVNEEKNHEVVRFVRFRIQ